MSGIPPTPASWPGSLRSVPASAPVLVVGGTFDPPHLAHGALSQRVRDVALPGAVLLFVPAAVSPFKKGRATTPAHHRVAMLTRAIEGVPDTGVWTDEIDRAAGSGDNGGGASYTIDTLKRLHALRPAAPLALLIGADQAAAFHRWKSARGICEVARVLVVLRPPYSTPGALIDEMRRAGFWTQAELEDWRARIVEAPLDPVSATDVRDDLRRRGVDAVADRIAPGVLAYIRENHLYTDS